jgi:two-component system, LytTR family, response regulator
MNVLVIDDEPSARSRLRRLLKSHPDLKITGEAEDGPSAVEIIEGKRPDLLFLDIEMPGFGGFDVLRSIAEGIPLPLVIFVTGFDHHALEAFQADALAYLLKPVEPRRLASAVERARRLYASTEDKAKEEDTVRKAVRDAPKNFHFIVVRKHGRIELLRPEQILWFEVESGLLRAQTTTGSYWTEYQISELEEGLAGNSFFRARREILVNLGGVREIRPSAKGGLSLVMPDAAVTEIAVSERRVPLLRELVHGL